MGLLAELFASRTRAEIIFAFTSRPGEKLYLREVSRLIKSDVSSVKQELDRLQRLGFLTSETSGNRRYLQVNESFPLYPELKAMALKTMGLGEALRAALAGIGGIDFAFVYGSVAKGEEKAGSDLDLFVLGDISGPNLHKALAKTKAALNREINTSRFGLADFKRRLENGDHFLSDIMKGKKIFVLGTEDDFRRAFGSRKDTDDCRSKRNLAEYTGTEVASEKEVSDLMVEARRFNDLVRSLIRRRHPGLLPPSR